MVPYDADSIRVLEGLEAVRVRPGMYISGTGKDGFHHLLWEIVDNSVDEVMNGHADLIQVTLHEDGVTVSVEDNGRGIPLDIHPKTKRPAIETVFTVLHAGGKFDESSYAHSGGLHGVGSSVVNALSDHLRVVVVRGDKTPYAMEFSRGKVTKALSAAGKKAEITHKGTYVCFRPDPLIFGAEMLFDPDLVEMRLEQKAYLNRKVRIVYVDQMRDTTKEFHFEGGLRDYVSTLLTRSQTPAVAEVFSLEKAAPKIEVTLAWTEEPDERVQSFVNGIPTGQGGTHEQGLRDAVSKAVRSYADTHQLEPRGITLTADDCREGLVAALAYYTTNPQFQGQTKDKLNNPDAKGIVEKAVKDAFTQWMNGHLASGENIVRRAVAAARARQASRSAVELVKRKGEVVKLNLPGKLADCSSEQPHECELFLVEGDSAGGSAKQGRDREFQAILPLRGKVLNVEGIPLSKVMANKELADLVQAMGCGIGADFDESKLRYGKIIILTDADSDGSHIATLLMTFFFRFLPGVISGGYLYLGQPPLFRVVIGNETQWAIDEGHLETIVKKNKRGTPEVTRFKGLGEMPAAMLYTTTMDPRNRTLLQIKVPDGKAVQTDDMISMLFGADAHPRTVLLMNTLEEDIEVDT